MFLGTILFVLCAGFLAGCTYTYLAAARPAYRELRDRDRDDRRRFRQDLHLAAARYEYAKEREVLRRPYVSPLPTELERLLVDVDTHNGSRKAPELRSVS